MKSSLSAGFVCLFAGFLFLSLGSAEEQKKPEPPKKPKAVVKKVQIKAQALVQLGGINFSNAQPVERENVDRADGVERFLLLAPRGPIVVEAKMQLDGEPFRNAREKLIDDMIKESDTNGDGKSTWNEGLENPRFLFGRTAVRIVVPPKPQPAKVPNKADEKKADNEKKADEKKDDEKKDDKKPKPQVKKIQAIAAAMQVLQLGPGQNNAAAIAHFDKNKDGIVDRDEARNMLAMTSGGPTYVVAGAYNRNREPDVKSVLDANNDGRLTKDELANAEEKLKAKDANDNDLLEAQELGGQGMRNINGQMVMIRAFGSVNTRSTAGHLLGPTMNAAAINEALKKKYGGEKAQLNAESFKLFPELFAKLDQNADGQLAVEEIANLNTIAPHVQIEANLGSTKPNGVVIKSIAKELQNGNQLRGGFTKSVDIDLADVKLTFAASAPRARTNYKQTAQRMLDRYDTNKDKKLEWKEMQKINQAFKQQFDRWDLNRDKVVTVDEMSDWYHRQQAPYLSRVSTTVAEKGPSLFSSIDTTGDKRLSLREMKTAGERLLARDKNKDGKIDLNEMPIQIGVAFNQGLSYSSVFSTSTTNRKPNPAAQKGPAWFSRMDRNGDGDVTLREFVGNEEQFKKIDTNGDGFIELKEAEAVKIPGASK